MKTKLLLLLTLLFASFFFLLSSHSVQALFDDVTREVKQLLNIHDKKFTIESSIELTQNGDIGKDGQIDAGDIVRFTYSVTNTTDNEYSFATLKTNIDRAQLNFIHNITGTASLTDDGKTIEIPNFRIGANQTATITFDARINYYTDNDRTISTEAEFFREDNNSVAKSSKKEVKANRIQEENIPEMIKQKINKESGGQ